MDECLPLGSLDAATLQTLLTQERTRRQDLEQEVLRPRAGLARQNEVNIRLEQRDAERCRELAEHRTLIAGLTEPGTRVRVCLLRQQMALLQQENAQLRGVPLGAAPDPLPAPKPAAPTRKTNTRGKRAPEHNAGRRSQERANRWETHAADTCPRCGEALSGGWIVRRVQVIDLPPVAPMVITQHRILRRQCSSCGRRVLPKPVGLEAGRIGRSRCGPRLMAAIGTMTILERLPGRLIQDRLQREYGLTIIHGGIVGLVQRMARAGHPAYQQLQADVRGSPVVHADETGWRLNGQQPQRVPCAVRRPAEAVWTASTTQTVYVHHGRRTNEEIDGILGGDFGGTIVADCYAAYEHFLGPKQWCWAHLVRDLEHLLNEHSEDIETVAWVEGILDVYERARQPRPSSEDGPTHQAVRAREERARQYEALILLLCPAALEPTPPYATLAARLRKHLTELFTFVRDPRVDATNNTAERRLRPLVIARKVSGGTRSAAGSTTRVTLYSLCATAKLQGMDPTAVYQHLLLAPPGAPSPLAGHSHLT